MVTHSPNEGLARRESEIMNVLYRKGEASASQVRNRLADDPSDSSVRTMLRLLERKGRVVHREEDGRYLYRPAGRPADIRRKAVGYLLETFFEGSESALIEALVSRKDADPETLARLERMMREARERNTDLEAGREEE